MLQTLSPLSTYISVPESRDENAADFPPRELDDAARYYADNGYVVIRGLVDPDACQRIMETFAATVKPYSGYLYRQTTSSPETNDFNEDGFVMNPLLNIQDLPSRPFAGLKQQVLDMFMNEPVRGTVRGLLGEPGKLIQSMYFEGNSATPAHQDTYYLDSEKIGSMVAAWFALEDIDAQAGRFYVMPTSNQIELAKNSGDINMAFNHEKYKALVRQTILDHGLEYRVPFLAQGDVLFWNSRTIHGSLPTSKPGVSRSSLTAHFIPESQRFLQFQSRIKPLRLKSWNGMQVHSPKDLDKWKNRVVLKVETTFPRSFLLTKKLATRALTR